MRAVRERRVYRYPHGFTVNMFGIIQTPLATRWLAEIAHPDRLTSRTRELIRERMQQDLNVTFTDHQLDEMLSVDENRSMLHAERFEAPASTAAGSSEKSSK
jgi:iron complex transport system substrate-binding protein